MAQSGQGRKLAGGEALKLRERYAWLNRFSDEEIREISFCRVGDRLREGEQYFDISRPERGIIRGQGSEQVSHESCLIARSAVSPIIWSKLTAEIR
jgi:hypothetical protein